MVQDISHAKSFTADCGTTISLKSGKKVDQVTLTFSTDDKNIEVCSITNIIFKGKV